MSAVINAKFKGYCGTCHFTFFKNERIFYNNVAHHVDCVRALRDEFPRQLQGNYKRIFGNIKRTKMANLLELEGAAKR